MHGETPEFELADVSGEFRSLREEVAQVAVSVASLDLQGREKVRERHVTPTPRYE